CLDKYVLRQAMRGLLPQAVRSRPKSPLPGNPKHRATRPASELWKACLPAAPEIGEFVDPRAVLEALRRDEAQGKTGRQDHVNRRPLNLAYWLAGSCRMEAATAEGA
ncbi:MAG: hypothetical protein D6773_00640, partial [Alphaproteobacteria bacterium]